MKFKGKNKKIMFQDQELEVRGVSVYRAIALRTKLKPSDEGLVDKTEDNIKTMAEVISECVVSPEITVEEVMGLEIEVFNELFNAIAGANGLGAPEGNAEKPATT